MVIMTQLPTFQEDGVYPFVSVVISLLILLPIPMTIFYVGKVMGKAITGWNLSRSVTELGAHHISVVTKSQGSGTLEYRDEQPSGQSEDTTDIRTASSRHDEEPEIIYDHHLNDAVHATTITIEGSVAMDMSNIDAKRGYRPNAMGLTHTRSIGGTSLIVPQHTAQCAVNDTEVDREPSTEIESPNWIEMGTMDLQAAIEMAKMGSMDIQSLINKTEPRDSAPEEGTVRRTPNLSDIHSIGDLTAMTTADDSTAL